MLLKYKIIIGVVVVAVLVAVGVTLGVVLSSTEESEDITEPPEYICESSKVYLKNRKLMDEIKNPHFLLDLKHGPPEIVFRSRAVYPQWAWLSQRVDHFNPSDLRTWQMRYLYNDEFYEDGGPMFIYLGGEWEISPVYLQTGQIHDLANQHKGYLFYTEHRYYGKSIPTDDLCTENLLYLSADQALADIVYFIEYQRNRIPTLRNSKVVIVGASYSATLATWARVKYPHVVDAALASSAPLLAIEDFYRYYEVVGDNMHLVSEECVAVIEEALNEIEETLATDEGVKLISEDFGTCWMLNVTEPHRSYFFASLISPFASLVQYATGNQIENVCNFILAESEMSSYEKFRAFIWQTYAGYCIADYDYFITYLDYPLLNGISRQWYYQTCTEYGFYQTTNSEKMLFGKNTVNIDLYRNICETVFEITPDVLKAGIGRTNVFYGALNPQVTKVVSVHGTVDPWHALGVLQDINAEAPVFVVEGTSHCADLWSESQADLPEMLNVKRKVKEYITDWITD